MAANRKLLTRREVLPLAGYGVMAGVVGYQLNEHRPVAGKSPVAVLRATNYEAELADVIYRGAIETGLNFFGKRVLIKPNLVEFDRDRPINTDPRFVTAAVEAIRKLGAAEVWIGEGPGHRRDTWGISEEADYLKLIPGFEKLFVDLNRDDVASVRAFDGEEEMFFAKTVLAADLIVSLAKMKTHHWAGATLSMKNFFGLVPGCVYGWPKNFLHYKGISRSILELNRLFPRSIAIVDGIMAMEGNGPIQGTGVPFGAIVMGPDKVAVDATCCRMMGLNPGKIDYLAQATHLGYWEEHYIDQRGERPTSLARRFKVVDEFAHLRLV